MKSYFRQGEDAERAEEASAHAQERAARSEERAERAHERAENTARRRAGRSPAPGRGLVRNALGRGASEAFDAGKWVGGKSAGMIKGAFSGAGGAINHVTNNGVKYFFAIVVVLHILDVFGLLSGGEYRHAGSSAAIWAILYVILAVVATFFLDGSFSKVFSKSMIIYLGLSVLAFAMPMLLSYIPDVVSRNSFFNFAIIISPVWGLFLLFSHHGEDLGKLRTIWIGIWIVLLVFFALGMIANTTIPDELTGQYRFDAWDTIVEVWDMLWGWITDVFGKLAGIGPGIRSTINANLNDTLGRSYSGQVDRGTNRDLGVHFENVRARDRNFFEGGEVVIYGEVVGETFNDEIFLSLRCFAIDRDGRVHEGVIEAGADDNDRVHFTMRRTQFMTCTLTNLTKGHYTVTMAGTFNFETWSYIQYYFAPYSVLEDIWRNDDDPAREFDIDKRPIATYNDGPVMLGLASESDQPIGIDMSSSEQNSQNNGLPPFGASIDNRWADGEVGSVQNISLLVPVPFNLVRCDRDPNAGTRAAPTPVLEPNGAYRRYEFTNIQSPNIMFESVTCFLTVDSYDAAQLLLGDFDLVMKTFVAKTKYLYTIHKDVRVQVQ